MTQPGPAQQPEFTVLSGKASACRKALYLEITGAKPSNPPDEQARNLMDLDLLAQQTAVNALQRQGWTVYGHREEHHVALDAGGGVTVRPRNTASHPELTEGKPVAVRVVSASDSRFKNWADAGPLHSHPEAYTDLGFMTHVLAMKRLVDPAQPQIFAILNRNTGRVEIDPVETADLDRRTHGVKRRLEELATALAANQSPPAEYARDSRRCRHCPFLDLCHGPAPVHQPKGPISTAELESAVATYAEAEDALAATKQYNTPRRKAMDAVKTYLKEHGIDTVTVHAGDRQWVASISRSEPKAVIDEAKLLEILTDAQKSQIYVEKSAERIGIRPLPQ